MGSSLFSNPITFSGSSTFSSSFQQVLQRAVGIASLPLHQMQNSINAFQSQQAALGGLQATFGSLQNAVQIIGSAVGGNVAASSSDSTVALAAAASGTLPGTYSLEVDNVGSSTATISNLGSTTITDPTSGNINPASSYTLSVNGVTHNFTLATNSLQALATAVNDAGAGVQATIVNLGSNSSPDYRLAVTSNNLGADTIQLSAGPTDLLGTLQTGTLAQYKVNGNATVLTSTSNHVTLAPGLTATLIKSAPGQAVNITVATNENSLTNALSTFANSYNGAVDSLSQHHGQNGGALTGDSVVFSLGAILRQISQFGAATGAVTSLSDLGLNLDSTGHLTLDPTKITGLTTSAIQQFLGTTTSGGFLQTVNNALKGVSDPTTGILTTQLSSLSTEISNENAHMRDQQNRIDDLQAGLQKQLTAADAAIAILEGQKTYYADLFAAQYLSNGSGTGGKIG